MSKRAIVIGAGFSGLSTATSLAVEGWEVTVLEKHPIAGGRARIFSAEGFLFDMGPSWYWMPDVFEAYFQKFGKKVSDYYQLIRLDPSYRVYFGNDDYLDIPASLEAYGQMLENLEKGSSRKLEKFLEQAAYKYKIGMKDLVYKPSRSLMEFADLRLLMALFKMDVFASIHTHIRRFFSNEKIIQLMEFPVLFLGALPKNTPALYSLMNFADISLGTWYPEGGMHQIVEGMVKLAKEMGVRFEMNNEVKEIKVVQGSAKEVITNQASYTCDVLVAGADYNHVEQKLLSSNYRTYSDKYWQKRVMAPSSLIFYLGVNQKLPNLLHHNLFFDTDFVKHAREIYDQPQWPSDPLFYVSVPSKTDPTVAPQGCENLFILMPVATGLEDREEIREKYFDLLLQRLEKHTATRIRENLIFKRSYAHQDFINDYHAFKGNAYGLANTLLQTAILKPSLKSKKVKNLFYTGQLTVPGPGVPPSLISGQVVAREICKEFK